MTHCEHGLSMATDAEWEERSIEFYEGCDCCGAPIHKDSYGSYFEGAPNSSRLLCTNCSVSRTRV